QHMRRLTNTSAQLHRFRGKLLIRYRGIFDVQRREDKGVIVGGFSGLSSSAGQQRNHAQTDKQGAHSDSIRMDGMFWLGNIPSSVRRTMLEECGVIDPLPPLRGRLSPFVRGTIESQLEPTIPHT